MYLMHVGDAKLLCVYKRYQYREDIRPAELIISHDITRKRQANIYNARDDFCEYKHQIYVLEKKMP